MKRSIVWVLVFSILAAPAYAGTTATFPMSAAVEPQLELTATVYEGNVGGPTRTAMDFGTLVSDTLGGALRADKFFTVYLSAVTSSRRYEILQTAAALTNGAVTLANGACITTPHDNGVTLPTGSVLGSRGSFVATDKLVYRSEAAGSAQSVAAAYAITNDPANGATEFISSDQPGGTYNSSVTFTLVLI